MDRVNERIKSIEQDCLELRLANQSFYREGVKQIKQRNQKRIFVSLILCLGGGSYRRDFILSVNPL